MRRVFIVLVALAMLTGVTGVAWAAPGGAPGPPDKPDKPNDGGPTSPPACAIGEHHFYDNIDNPFVATGAGEYSTFYVEVSSGLLDSRPPLSDLCVEIAVDSGSLSDLNVALIDFNPEGSGLISRRCGAYWPGGVDRKNINNGGIFDVGFSLDDRGELSAGDAGFCGSVPSDDQNDALTVLVMPQPDRKTDEVTLHVRLGFVNLTP